MFNFYESFTYIFKEKKWGYKFLLPFLLQLLIIIPGLLVAFIDPSSTSAHMDTYRVYSMSMRNNYDFTTSLLALIVTMVTFASIIPLTIVSIWYMYENVQSGIFKRHTKAIWGNKFDDTLKKVSKYFLTQAIYNIFITLIAFIVLGIVCVIGFALVVLGAAIVQNVNTSGNYSFLVSGIALSLFCFFFILFIIACIIVYIWMQTGILRLIATNSFGEGLKLQENWKLGMKHKWKFFGLFMVILLSSLIFGMGYVAIALTSGVLGLGSPILNFILQFVLQIILALAMTYAVYFVYPRLLGQLFRKVIEEEHSLKFIKL